MIREKFHLSSDQMELLLAFEKAGSLDVLSEMMAKDPSVVSRRLKELARLAPVMLKVRGRWQITSLGRQLNSLNRDYIQKLELIIPSTNSSGRERKSIVPLGSVLVVINVQKALHFSGQRKRSNLKAEDNILLLLKFWRKKKWPIIHIKHVSENASSSFYRNSEGVEFIKEFQPQGKEIVIEKQKGSAFMKTALEKRLDDLNAPAIVLTGFTAGECIDATARQASDLDIVTFVIGDATATFEIIGRNGKLYNAEKVHRSTMVNLHASFADVIDTSEVL